MPPPVKAGASSYTVVYLILAFLNILFPLLLLWLADPGPMMQGFGYPPIVTHENFTKQPETIHPPETSLSLINEVTETHPSASPYRLRHFPRRFLKHHHEMSQLEEP
jgi:hypothetical protein